MHGGPVLGSAIKQNGTCACRALRAFRAPSQKLCVELDKKELCAGAPEYVDVWIKVAGRYRYPLHCEAV